PALAVWMEPSADQLGLLFLVGLTGTLSQLFAVRAWIVAEATAVAPFDYSRLLYAALLGALFFGEIPGWNTALGATIIVAATLYIARREALLRRKAATEKPGEPAS
ncbi:MAG: EamA/RhaT family transporter, partial [Alphaproteobacteria bacterium]|nr:EamA/RhaT family transporter [Alphaproteobacteria bacterium]